MRPYEYARPESEAEALEFLNDDPNDAALLAGGTDLIDLMKHELLAPKRVVDLKNVREYSGVAEAPPAAAGGSPGPGLLVGATTTLEELRNSPLTARCRSLLDVVDGVRAIQIQSNGTLGGDLCHFPNCWYFRSGCGLFGNKDGKSLPEIGDNRYHAVFGNGGAAKYVSASRFAPGLIAAGAKVRIAGPKPGREEWLPLETFFRTPRTERQSLTALKPGQLLTHVWLPEAGSTSNAAYEVLPTEGLCWPLAAAGVSLQIQLGVVVNARIVMGHVAPVPWRAKEAEKALRGKSVNVDTADWVGEVAVRDATPLSMNEYKVQLAKTAVKRAILRAAGQLEGGL